MIFAPLILIDSRHFRHFIVFRQRPPAPLFFDAISLILADLLIFADCRH
jgi:hypothetical protein